MICNIYQLAIFNAFFLNHETPIISLGSSYQEGMAD